MRRGHGLRQLLLLPGAAAGGAEAPGDRPGGIRAAPATRERDLSPRAIASGTHAGLRRMDEAGIRRHPPLTVMRHNGSVPTPLFQAHGLHKRYGESVVVNDLSFEIAPGECLGVIGPNGAGKTTTIRMCLGLTTPDHGTIEALGGLSMPRDARAIKAQLGVV